MSDTFDPFDLPSSFDPLGRDSLTPTGQSAYLRRGQEPTGQSAYLRRGQEPTGQSAYLRRGQEPTGQSAYSRQPPPRHLRADGGTLRATAAAPAERAVNPRLAHLLPPAEPALRPHPSPRGTGGAGTDGAATDGTATDIGARLAALEDEVAILEARLTSLEPLLAHKQAVHQDRLLEAVAKLIDGRLGRR
jgi:hypothetical protein